MKKRIAITLAGLLAVAGLSSCGGSDDSTLVIWHDKTDAVVEVLQKAIEEKLPEEKVEFVRRDSMTDQLKLVGNDPSSCPDMYIFAHDKIGLFATLGILEDLDSLIDPSSYEESVPLTLEAMEYEGTNYGLPLYYETTLFLYNRDLVGDKDPSLPALPSTTEELYAYMQEYTDGRRYGFVEQHSTPYYASAWINGYGGFVINEKATPGISDAKTKEGAAYNARFAPTMSDGTYDTITNLFLEGKADGILAGPWFVSSVKDAGIDCGYVSLSRFELPNGEALAPYEGIQGFAVMKYAEAKKDAIGKALTAMATLQVATDLAKNYNCTPALEAASEVAEVTSNEMIKETQYTIAESAVPTPNIPEMGVMWTPFTNFLTAVNKGENIDEAATKYQADAVQAIENMH